MTCADCEDTFTDTYEELQEQLDATEDHRDVLLATLDAERAKSAELHAEVELWREATKGLKWMQQRDRVMRERDELLAALEYCLGELDLPTEERDAARHFTSIDMARAAIARATGGEP